jgi:hypothetical protein
MKTSTDREPLYVKYGEVVFAIDGVPLNIYKNIELSKQKKYKNYLFCPFRSYQGMKAIGGKYIDLTMPKGILLL